MSVGAVALPLMVAGGVFSAMSSYMGGQQQAKAIQSQADYNAQIYEQQAEMIKSKQKIQDYQMDRQIARTRSSMIAKTSGKGLLPSGSPLAVMADVESQMLFDQAINKYNNKVDQTFALSQANSIRAQGSMEASLAKKSGMMNAFSSILNTGSMLGMMGYGGTSTPKGNIFTSSGWGWTKSISPAGRI